MYKGHSINKLQNGVTLQIFKMVKYKKYEIYIL